MNTPAVAPSASSMTVIRNKPLMNMKNILLMNLGFFGIQYSFGMQQTAINPIYTMLGASADELPILNMAGPITGLLIQPIIGAMSDRTWVAKGFFRGRRRPFFLIGALGCSICLALFPFVAAVWMAALLLWLLDMSNNTAMEPYRAFISDRLPPSQLAKGFLAQSFFTGFGITLANLCIWAFPSLIPGYTGKLPTWVLVAFMIGAVCSIGTVLVSVLSTPELAPTESELAEIQAKRSSGGPAAAIKEIWEAIVDMPTQLKKLALVYFFQWYAMNIYWQFVSLSVAKTVYNTTDTTSKTYEQAVSTAASANATYNVVTFCVAFLLAGLARRHGAKWVHSICLFLAAIALAIFPHITNATLLLVPMIGLGIAWASIMGVPYIMAVRMIPSTRYGVYMGLINMMIVIPMLIQTLTFGPIYKNLLGDDPTKAITMCAVMLALAAIAMLWIKEPPIVRDVEAVLDDASDHGHAAVAQG